MPGRGRLTITGQLGEVMQESAQAALSYVRANAAELVPELPEDWFANHDIHVHVPAGRDPQGWPERRRGHGRPRWPRCYRVGPSAPISR